MRRPRLYAVLAERGFFPRDWLAEYGQPGSRLPEQMSPGCVPGVELATGSLGHGLSCRGRHGVGRPHPRQDYRVCVVLSDGECNEGSVWEAAMFAAARELGNLLAVVDFNRWQATGRSDDILGLTPLTDKWAAFGWHVAEVDGHNLAELQQAMIAWRQGSAQPTCLIAHTIKGRGVSFMEDDNNWHYRIPSAEEVLAARGSWGCHEKRICPDIDRLGRGGRPGRAAHGRHRQPPVRRVQVAVPGPILQLRGRRSQHDERGGRSWRCVVCVRSSTRSCRL